MPATTGQFSSLMAPGLRKVIFQELDETQQVYNKIFNVGTSNRKYEDDQQITGLGLVPEKPEGVAIEYSDPSESYSKRYTHTAYGLGIRITREMYKDDQYGIAKRWAGALGRSANATIETQAMNIFNNGFTDTGPDGSVLCVTTHTLKGTGGTSSNAPTAAADLSVASLEAGLTAFRNIRDDQNLRTTTRPAILLVSPNDEFTALKIVQTPQEPFNANNTVNIISRRGLQVIVGDYLTDTDAWFLLGKPSDTQLNFLWRERPWMDNDDDFNTKDLLYTIYFRFSVGYSDWRGVYGTAGA